MTRTTGVRPPGNPFRGLAQAGLARIALTQRGPLALQALILFSKVNGGRLSQELRDCVTIAADFRVRRAASLLLDPAKPTRLLTLAQLLPKAVLHVHLDGSVKPQTVFELAQAKGINLRSVQGKLPEIYSASELARFMTIPPGGRVADFWEFLISSFNLPIEVMQDRESIERVAEELMEQAYQDGALHVDVRFAPCVHLKRGMCAEDVIEAVLAGLQRGAAKYHVSYTATPAIYRDKIDPKFGDEFADSPETTAKATRNVSRKYHGRVPLALDLVGFETPYPPEQFQKWFDLVDQAGIPITIHAGETPGTERNILTAVRQMHARRIGHGIQVLKLSEAEQRELIARQIAFEVCPTMNVQLMCIDGDRLEDHPVRQMIDKGFNVTISPDNMTIAGVTASAELVNLQERLGVPIFSGDRISDAALRLLSSSAEAAFVAPQRRRAMRAEFAGYYSAINQLLEILA